MTSPETIAVDLGGTKLRLAAKNVNNGLVEWEQKAVSPERLPTILKHMWKKMGWTNVGRLIVGSKGVWTRSERQSLLIELKGLAKITTVMSDVELALQGAFAPHLHTTQRVLLVAGTGSIAVGLTGGGRLVRSGGLGPPTGDAGSGWWIGKEFLRHWTDPRRRQNHKRSVPRRSIRQIADLAKTVVAHAPSDPVCSKIVRTAQSHLAQLVFDIRKKMNSHSPLWLSWGGSLMDNMSFRNGVLAALKKRHPHLFHFVTPKDSPARIAARHPTRIFSTIPSRIPPRL